MDTTQEKIARTPLIWGLAIEVLANAAVTLVTLWDRKPLPISAEWPNALFISVYLGSSFLGFLTALFLARRVFPFYAQQSKLEESILAAAGITLGCLPFLVPAVINGLLA